MILQEGRSKAESERDQAVLRCNTLQEQLTTAGKEMKTLKEQYDALNQQLTGVESSGKKRV